jgi:hypothetical protein
MKIQSKWTIMGDEDTIMKIFNEYSLFKKKNQITFHYKIYRWQEPTLCYEIISMYIMYKWEVWSKLISSNNAIVNVAYMKTKYLMEHFYAILLIQNIFQLLTLSIFVIELSPFKYLSPYACIFSYLIFTCDI